ncbi:MAG: hypothetical protein OK454_03285 [Thaumarchaeota archaeon]|nr:hypothetical protein [Nitrososphaerota archaeon]
MRISRIVIIIAVVAIIGILALFVYSSFAAPASGPWVGGPAYPLQASDTSGVVGQSCVNSTSTIYCIGGIDYNGASRNNVYSATVSSSGMSAWSSDVAYPQTVGLQSCVSSGGYAYCVGGSYDDAGDDIASAYFAPLTGSGTGSWDSTTSYPVAVDSQACVSSSGYIYCVGGENETDGTNATAIATNSAWYAPLSSSGIGAWKQTTAYSQSVSFETCAASSMDIFCLGGVDISGNGVSTVYYAPLSSSGIGQWSATTSYPLQGYGQLCVMDSGSIICVGGVPNGTTSSSDAVYSAPVSASGVGAWLHAPNYPFGVETACAAASGNLYCAGGYQDSSAISASTYYAPVQSLLA